MAMDRSKKHCGLILLRIHQSDIRRQMFLYSTPDIGGLMQKRRLGNYLSSPHLFGYMSSQLHGS